MAERLVGTINEGSTNTTLNYLYHARFQAIASGVGAVFKVFCLVPGNVKIAIYSDSGTYPNALLAVNNTGQAVTAGWNNLTIPNVNIVSGTYYWLAFITDTSGAVARSANSGTYRYVAATYSTFSFADPAPVGLSLGVTESLVAVWTSDSGPTIISVSDTTIGDNQSNIYISGTGFSASGNIVALNSTLIKDGINILQDIESESASGIYFTAKRGTLFTGRNYLFVTNNSAFTSSGQAIDLVYQTMQNPKYDVFENRIFIEE